MADISQDFEIWSGDTLLVGFTITNPDGTKPTLSSPTAVWRASTTPEPTTAQTKITKTSAAGQITLTEGASSWGAVVALVTADTETLRPGNYYHALRVFDGAESFTTSTGIMTLYGSVPPSS